LQGVFCFKQIELGNHAYFLSPFDAVITRTIIQAGKLVDIDALDYLVTGQEGRLGDSPAC